MLYIFTLIYDVMSILHSSARPSGAMVHFDDQVIATSIYIGCSLLNARPSTQYCIALQISVHKEFAFVLYRKRILMIQKQQYFYFNIAQIQINVSR